MTLNDLQAAFYEKRRLFRTMLISRFELYMSELTCGVPAGNLRMAMQDRHTLASLLKPERIISEWENASERDGLCESRMYYRHEEGVRDAYVAAKVYVIARDETMKAAMLWKLQNQ